MSGWHYYLGILLIMPIHVCSGPGLVVKSNYISTRSHWSRVESPFSALLELSNSSGSQVLVCSPAQDGMCGAVCSFQAVDPLLLVSIPSGDHWGWQFQPRLSTESWSSGCLHVCTCWSLHQSGGCEAYNGCCGLMSQLHFQLQFSSLSYGEKEQVGNFLFEQWSSWVSWPLP